VGFILVSSIPVAAGLAVSIEELFNCVCVHPCVCGYYGDSVKACTCAPAVVTKYQKRISGPLLDRIDIHIEVPRVDYEKLSGDRIGETGASIRARVQAARDIQTKRYSSIRNSNTELSNIVCNADMRIGEIRQFCRLQACPERVEGMKVRV
jgi:magnesium chelatase family protein